MNSENLEEPAEWFKKLEAEGKAFVEVLRFIGDNKDVTSVEIIEEFPDISPYLLGTTTASIFVAGLIKGSEGLSADLNITPKGAIELGIFEDIENGV